MLVLSRRRNETIVIDGCVQIEVLQIKGNEIRLGIQAPASVKILRGELTPFACQSQPLELNTDHPQAKNATKQAISLHDVSGVPGRNATAQADTPCETRRIPRLRINGTTIVDTEIPSSDGQETHGSRTLKRLRAKSAAQLRPLTFEVDVPLAIELEEFAGAVDEVQYG